MHVELSAGEARELRATLEASLQQLLTEIAKADHRAYREELRGRYQRLDAVRHRLDAHLDAAQEAYG